LQKILRHVPQRKQAMLKKRGPVRPEDIFPLRPTLPLPADVNEARLRSFIEAVRVTDAPESEMLAYGSHDFRRFVYTWGLTRGLGGHFLELGANPYFTTMLLREFSQAKLSLANFFVDGGPPTGAQDVSYLPLDEAERKTITFTFEHFNIEREPFPYADETFDVVLFCEIIEHLLTDPVAVLGEIRRVLKPQGSLILTTPNVSRLENVTRMVAGANIYDPYSGYGPYGRHNREYNKHDLYLLLGYAGFSLETIFSADVNENAAGRHSAVANIEKLVRFREQDLGQYIFIRAKRAEHAHALRPDFLYRSLPPGQLERWPP
jgi:SAM-dependent methyltransferase